MGQETKEIGHEVVGYGAVESDGTGLAEGCEIERKGRGEYFLRVPEGIGEHSIDVQLQGSEARRYSLEQIDPYQHLLKTFKHIETATMMEDTGFEMVVQINVEVGSE